MKKSILALGLSVFMLSCDGGDDMKIEPIPGDAVAVTSTSIVEDAVLPELSVYHLPATWTNQNGETLEMKELKGKVLVMVMIYTSCKSACPRLVADMRNIEKQIASKDLDKVEFIMVSIDPETDTPERLKKFSIDNQMVDDHWMFLRGTPEDTREFAAVLAVNYKKISPIDFSHSNIISVFDEQGVLIHQKEGLGVDNDETVAAINAEIHN